MPLRLSELVKRLAALGVRFEDGGTKHPCRFRKSGKRPFPVSAHNGLRSEIGDQYIKALCRDFEIDQRDVYDKKRNKRAKKP